MYKSIDATSKNILWVVAFLAIFVCPNSMATKIGLKNFRELPVAYSTVLATPLNPTISSVIKKVQSRLPQKGDIEELNSPMLLAAFELAGSYCSAFTSSEALKSPAERLIFGDVDFSQGTKQFVPALQRSLLNNLSETFWFRMPLESEVPELNKFFDEILATGTTPSNTRQVSFLLCTYFATSVQFLVD